MKRTRISVVGIGLGGQIHMKRLLTHPSCELDSVVAPDRAHNQQLADSLGVPIFHTIDECIDRRRPDGVIIASPNSLHFEHTSVCIARAIPVLLEKPITADIAQARELCNLVENTGAIVLLGHHRVHNPILGLATQMLRQGRIGEIVAVSGSAQFFKPDHYFIEGPWRKAAGGGPIFINMIHEIDSLRRLIGEISEVQAICSNKIRRYEVEDTAVINFQFQSGALGSFVLSDVTASARSWEQTSKENPRYPWYADEDCYLVSGTIGSLSIPSLKLKYYADPASRSWWVPFASEQVDHVIADPIERQLDHFKEIIEGTTSPLVTAKDGYINLLIADAIKRSARSRTTIAIDWK